jgi:hypothetical protein
MYGYRRRLFILLAVASSFSLCCDVVFAVIKLECTSTLDNSIVASSFSLCRDVVFAVIKLEYTSTLDNSIDANPNPLVNFELKK